MRTDLLSPFTGFWDKLIKRFPEKQFFPPLLAAFILVGFTPLLIPGIPAGDDIGFHLSRFVSLTEGLKNWQFPVWINFNTLEGFGCTQGLFYPDLYLYPITVLNALGMPLIAAYKLFILAWALLVAFSMYYVALRISKEHFTAFAAER
jgi:hypothetical protein